MKITFLGSSHGVPEAHRKCSCIMIEVGENIYFVDMGTPTIDELRKRGISSLRCVYSLEPAIQPHHGPDAEMKGTGRPAPGSVSFVPSVAGLYLAYETMRMIAIL